MSKHELIDGQLISWDRLADREWKTLLLGNGLSINLWSKFKYQSLFSSAALNAQAKRIFQALDTVNFERCLECLHHANVALNALGIPTEPVDTTYKHVRDALFNTVGQVHVQWSDFPAATQIHIANEIAEFQSVFTTNYDLCLYWSQMWVQEHCENSNLHIVDLFWADGNRFDPRDSEPRSAAATRVLYLHGGIHLWQEDHTGNNGKWVHGNTSLLDLADKYIPESNRRPLFVSEGSAEAKSQSIRKSSYLSFCLDQLTRDEKPTIVFGHALADQDKHILAALNRGRRRRIAISIYPTGDSKAIATEKARLLRDLGDHDVEFFDSTTHPLGAPALSITD